MPSCPCPSTVQTPGPGGLHLETTLLLSAGPGSQLPLSSCRLPGLGGVCWWFRKEEGFAGRRIYGVAWVRKRGTRGEEEEACLQKLSWAGWGLSVGSTCPLLLLTVCSRKCERNPAAQSRGPNWTLRTSAITGPSRADWHYCCCCCWVASVVSDSVQPHRLQPTRLPCPWDSPGKNTGVGCHFLLQCMKVKSQSEVAQSCLTLSDPMDCSPPCLQSRDSHCLQFFILPPGD